MNYYLKKMIELGADGIDFYPIFKSSPFCNVIASYTRKDFENNNNIATPKSSYAFWVDENGIKKYLFEEGDYKMVKSTTPKFEFGDNLLYTSSQKQELKTPCVFIRDDNGKAVIIFKNAEWVARVNYNFLSPA